MSLRVKTATILDDQHGRAVNIEGGNNMFAIGSLLNELSIGGVTSGYFVATSTILRIPATRFALKGTWNPRSHTIGPPPRLDN
ncbi:hypothetical protein PM082_008706 [Marasmius tenuissimus]|nr:hypothetical protein PM082_008706 [Marasmius tenuissimus]